MKNDTVDFLRVLATSALSTGTRQTDLFRTYLICDQALGFGEVLCTSSLFFVFLTAMPVEKPRSHDLCFMFYDVLFIGEINFDSLTALSTPQSVRSSVGTSLE